MNALLARALGGLLFALALLGGGYWWGDRAATDRAAAETLAQERARTMAAAIQAARDRTTELKGATDLVATSFIYQKGLSDGLAAQKNVVAGVRSGAVRLSVPTRADPACTAAAPAAGAGRRDGEARAELSVAGAEFLTGLFNEADAVVLQLTTCQADLDSDRAMINQERPAK